ncbi:MAG: SDR family NAD(P)-dependent oxidoreductase, partial [Candidatus Heimdallarchaeaceae archaeon]
AEIFGIVREKWSLELDETVNLADFTTAEKIAEYIQQNIGQPIVSESVVTQKEPVDGLELNSVIKRLISRATGYEPDLIDDEMDLEEDLGIDTIKQAEIFGEIREEYDMPLDESISLAEFRSINDIANYVSKYASIDTKKPEVGLHEKPKEEVAIVDVKDKIRLEKLIPAPVPLNKDKTEKISLAKLSNLIVDLNSSLTLKLEKEFKEKNIKFRVFKLLEDSIESIKIDNFDNFIIVLPDKKTSPGYIDQEYYEKLFATFQEIDLDSECRIAVISSENFFGYETDSYPLSGGVSGFFKTLGFEFEMKVKHIYSDKLKEILPELEYWDGNVEIAYSKSIRYTLVHTSMEELVSDVSELDIDDNDVLLVTGGGRGITFKCIEAVCSLSKPKVALIGIEDISECSLEELKLTEVELKDKKQKLIDELKEKEEKVTPVMIERKWNQYLFNLEVLRNIQTLEMLGIKASYHKVDVTNKDAVKEATKKIEEEFQSKVTHIVHGAGLEESKQFKKKKFSLSRLIVSVKVEGIWNILNAIDKKKLKRVIYFTSIAGRFGNPGQVDYSFANGYLSRLSWMLNQQGIPSLACDWSAWGGIGMATRGSIMQVLEAQGIYPIPMDKGIQTFVNLFSNYSANEVIVSCGLGPFDETQPVVTEVKNKKYPMIESIEFRKPVFRGRYTLT